MSFINSAAKEILDSIQAGYYVTISDILDHHISSTPELTDGEANIWRYLYRKARFNADLCCTETRAQIAANTRKQKSSVPNLIRRLVSKGYLEVKASIDQCGLNTYFIKLPQNIIEQLRAAPKRGKGSEFQASQSTKKIDKSVLNSINKSNIISFQEMINSRLYSGLNLSARGSEDTKQQDARQKTSGEVTQCMAEKNTVDPLLINNHQSVGNFKSVSKQENFEGDDALLDRFSLFLKEIILSNSSLKDSPGRLNMLALSQFNESDRKKICELLLRKKWEASHRYQDGGVLLRKQKLSYEKAVENRLAKPQLQA